MTTASLSLATLTLKQETFNQTYGAFDHRSPVYKSLMTSQSVKNCIQGENLPIQFSDLTLIPPKLYGPDNFNKFSKRKFPNYPLNLVGKFVKYI
jgi:hypothetical protein